MKIYHKIIYQKKIENKLRFENTIRKNGWKINFGTGLEYVTYKNNTLPKKIYLSK